MHGFLLDLFFPPRCLNCAAHLAQGVLCEACRGGVRLHETLFCGNCGARRPTLPADLGGRAGLPDGRRTCHAAHPYLLAAATDYSEPAVQALVRGLKFQGVRAAAGPLGDYLGRYAQGLGLSPAPGTLIVPVPLSARRMRERGYNQAALLARELASRFSLEFADALTRIRHSPPQSGLASHAERGRNVADAFRSYPGVQGRAVWLVDDVATSGSTLFHAAKALKAAGARNITAFVAAKA